MFTFFGDSYFFAFSSNLFTEKGKQFYLSSAKFFEDIKLIDNPFLSFVDLEFKFDFEATCLFFLIYLNIFYTTSAGLWSLCKKLSVITVDFPPYLSIIWALCWQLTTSSFSEYINMAGYFTFCKFEKFIILKSTWYFWKIRVKATLTRGEHMKCGIFRLLDVVSFAIC